MGVADGPADVRNSASAFRETPHGAREEPETVMGAELLARLEKELSPKTDAEERDSGRCALTKARIKAKPSQHLHPRRVGTDPRQDDMGGFRIPIIGRTHDAHLRTDELERTTDTEKIARPIVDELHNGRIWTSSHARTVTPRSASARLILEKVWPPR
jgi:hypothetical protein